MFLDLLYMGKRKVKKVCKRHYYEIKHVVLNRNRIDNLKDKRLSVQYTRNKIFTA